MQHDAANYSHQEHLFDRHTAKPVVIFGAGSVGGYATNFLAKMGAANIEVWDDDTIESHNTPMSIYSPRDIGRLKVDSLREIIERDANRTIGIHPEKYTGQMPLRNKTVLCCLDDMDARKAIWEQVEGNPTIDLFCDTRVAEFYVEVFSIDPNSKKDQERYRALLFGNKEAKRQTCGSHGTVLTSTYAAWAAVQSITTFWQTSARKWHHAERCDTLARVI